MSSEGYGSRRFCVSVCVSVKSHLPLEASLRPENAVTGNEDQKICGVFSDTALFQSYGTSCIGAVGHFSLPNTRVRF